MLLEISTTHQPASELGFLLEKHPARIQEFDLTSGKALVFYREVSDARCTAVLLLDVDPVGLIRGRGNASLDMPLQQYVNDRPYVASSFMSVAIGLAFRSALAGKCRHRPELATTPIPLEARIPVLPCHGGERFLRSLFEPLGCVVEAEAIPLDTSRPDWGQSNYYSVVLRATCMLREFLQYLYVLIPVLDDEKHYWVAEAEVEKLLRHAGDWLGAHPARDIITKRYLKHRGNLARDALARLLVEEERLDQVEEQPAAALAEERLEEKISLNQQRLEVVTGIIRDLGATTVVDLGCGEARLLGRLLKLRQLTRIAGMDVSIRALEHAAERLNLDKLPPRERERIELLHGSLIYRDKRLAGFDVATVIEVIEHLDAARLGAFERVLFEFARPRHVVVTTPNSEFNVRFPDLPRGKFRHSDHRFEWTRAEFRAWAATMSARFGYEVTFASVGEDDPQLGPPTQAAVFALPQPGASAEVRS